MLKETDHFYDKKEEPSKSCLLALRRIILKIDPEVSEAVKYGMPCFCFKSKMFCYLWTDKKTAEPYILFVEGKRLNHPKLEQGKRSRMKVYNINPNMDISIEDLELLLLEAIGFYKNGIIKI
jgi:hypothetical protein